MFGWKQWDIHLAKFKKKPINILEIGVYKGDALEKFAEVFLDSEPESHYYGVDTWEGSPEYVGIDFKEIEKKTLEKRSKSPSKARIHLIKQESTLALPMLLSKGLEFDIIFIDASHVAKDVLYDSVLCMRMLREKGVLIFDDYLWEKLEPSLFTPKPAIDSVLEIYKDVIDVLYVGYQVIIQKVPPKFSARKTIRTVISGFSDLLNKFWKDNSARVLIQLDHKPLPPIQFKFVDPATNPDFIISKTTGVRYYANEITEQLWRLPTEILTVYSRNNFEEIKKDIETKKHVNKKMLLLLEFNIYSIRNFVSQKKIGETVNEEASINLYSIDGFQDFDKYIERVNKSVYGRKVEETIPVNIYTNEQFDFQKVKAFLQLCSRIKPTKRVVGMASLIQSSKQSYSRNLLINFLSLKAILLEKGSFDITIGITGIFLNDYLRLLRSCFKSVALYFIPFKINTIMFKLTCKGFLGISDDLFMKVLKRLPLNLDFIIEKIFKDEDEVFIPEVLYTQLVPQYKTILKEFNENKDVIMNHLDKFKTLQTRRTLDDIYAYVLK